MLLQAQAAVGLLCSTGTALWVCGEAWTAVGTAVICSISLTLLVFYPWMLPTQLSHWEQLFMNLCLEVGKETGTASLRRSGQIEHSMSGLHMLSPAWLSY